MSFGQIDELLFAFYCLESFANNFSSINPNDIKILRLDASGYDDYNEPYFIKFQSLVIEIMQFNKYSKISFFFTFEFNNKQILFK